MPDASSYSAIDARLARLEGQVRTQRRLLVLAMAAVVAAFGAGAAGAAQKAFTFTDTQGHTRVKLDQTGLQLFDANGKRRILLGFNSSGKPSLYLQDAHGNYRLGEYISDKDQPVLRMSDASDKGRLYIDLDSFGPGVEFYDTTENPRLLVGLASDGSGIVHTITSNGKVGTALEDDKVTVTDSSGADRVYLGTSSSGNGILKIYDSQARERAYMGVFTDGNSGFQALDSTGNATWTSP
jgi:hypothetical protein